MKNPLQVLHESHPRIWSITIFVPMVVITIVGVPMVFLYEVIVDIPKILSNFWSDIKGLFHRNTRICKDVVGGAWDIWANAAALAKCKQKVSK